MCPKEKDDLIAGYCPACGGWDRKQGGTGHKLMCPVGQAGAPISESPRFSQFEKHEWIRNLPHQFGMGVEIEYDVILDHWADETGRELGALTGKTYSQPIYSAQDAAFCPDYETSDIFCALIDLAEELGLDWKPEARGDEMAIIRA